MDPDSGNDLSLETTSDSESAEDSAEKAEEGLGTRAEIEERLRDIQCRLERLPRDELRKGTERMVEKIRVKISGEDEF